MSKVLYRKSEVFRDEADWGILTFHIFFMPQDIFNLWENKFNFENEIYFPWRKIPKEIEGMNLSNITEIGDLKGL